MGLFSTQYQITTGTSAQRVVEDDFIVPVWKELPLKASIHNSTINRAFKQELMAGMTARTERFVAQAKDPERYSLGLLDHTLLSEALGASETEAHLESVHGGPVSMDYHFFGTLNLTHVGFAYLEDQLRYRQVGNMSEYHSELRGFPVHLEHMAVRVNTTRQGVPEAAEATTEPLPLAMLPLWETAGNQRYLPWDNPFDVAETWELSSIGLTQVIYHFAYLQDTPVAGTPTALDWEANGVPELAVLPDRSYPDFHLVGYSFEAAFGATTAVMDDFIVRFQITLNPEALGLNLDQQYYHTRYRHGLTGLTHENAYFTHAANATSIASLTGLADAPAEPMNFMPWIFFRSNFQSLATPENENTTRYQQSTDLLKILGYEFQEIANSLYENPDINDISQSFLMFGIDMTTQREQGIRYLYEFFHWLNLDNSGLTLGHISTANNWSPDNNGRRAIVFHDDTARMTLDYAGITQQLRAGLMNPEAQVGDVEASVRVVNQTFTQRIIRNDFNFNDGRQIVVYVDTIIPINVYEYRMQLTTERFSAVLVADPKINYRLTDRQGQNSADVFTETDQGLIIPLSHDMAVEHFNFVDRRSLYLESLHIINNAYIRTRLEWYETSTFAFVLKAVALVATVISLGSLTAPIQATYTAILATVGNIVAAMIITALIMVSLQIGLAKVFELVAEEIGSRWGTIGSLILATMAAYALATGNPSAKQLIYASNGLMEASTAQLQNEIDEMGESLSELQDQLQEQIDIGNEIDEAYGQRRAIAERVGLIRMPFVTETAQQHMDRSYAGITLAEDLVNLPEITLANGASITQPINIVR